MQTWLMNLFRYVTLADKAMMAKAEVESNKKKYMCQYKQLLTLKSSEK